MKPVTRWVLLAIVLQAALIAVYAGVEHRRSDGLAAAGRQIVLSADAPVPMDRQLPKLSLRRADGAAAELRVVDRPALVHFWATWCPPCRVELPGLLAVPTQQPVDVIAIALDARWLDVEEFLGASLDRSIVLGRSNEAERLLGIASLPVTFLVEPGGRITHRFDGARDWTNSPFLRAWVPDGSAREPSP